MKSLSAALIVATGMYGLREFVPLWVASPGDSATVVSFLGMSISLGITCAGMGGWLQSLKSDS